MGKTAIPQVLTLMTAFPYHVDGQTPLADAARLMLDKNIHHLVINRADGGFGLLSERELQHHHALYGGEINPDLTVSDLCSEEAVCADVSDPVDRVLDIMAARHLGSVVVLREGELAGIFTTTDACRHLADLLRKQAGHDDLPDLIA